MLESIYWYCTDFCIHMANMLGISYVKFNMWLFLILLPALIFTLVLFNVKRYLIDQWLRKGGSTQENL